MRREDLTDEQWDSLSPAQKELYLNMNPLKMLRCKHCGSIALENKGRRKRIKGSDRIQYKCTQCGRSMIV